MTNDDELLELAERLDERAKKEREWAANSSRVVELLQPEFDKFEARTGHNIYTVRLFVDERNAARKGEAFACDLERASAALRARISETKKDRDNG